MPVEAMGIEHHPGIQFRPHLDEDSRRLQVSELRGHVEQRRADERSERRNHRGAMLEQRPIRQNRVAHGIRIVEEDWRNPRVVEHGAAIE